jgi:hypothetical protein
MTVIVRIYYCAALLPVFVLQITSMLLLHIVLKVKEPVLPDIISQVVSLFAVFTKGSANIMIISVIFSIAAASLMFVISTTAFIRLNDYKINDSKKALAASLAVLVLCIFFAKGKVNGFISFEDSRVTSSASLNRYAVNGVFKTVKDFAAFNPSNIKSLSYKDVDDRMGDDRYLFKPDFSMPDNGYEPDDIEEVTPDKSLKRIGAFLKKLKK